MLTLPAVSVSSQLSSGVYFASLLALLALLAHPVALVYSASQERSAHAVAEGLATAIDTMSPGTSILARLESYPMVPVAVSLGGDGVTASFGSATATAAVRWNLQAGHLSPGLYNFTLKGGAVSIAPARDG